MGSHQEDYQAVLELIEEAIEVESTRLQIDGFKYLEYLPEHIVKLSNSLVSIRIAHCYSLQNLEVLASCKSLTSIRLFELGSLGSVDFLSKLDGITWLSLGGVDKIYDYSFLENHRNTLTKLSFFGGNQDTDELIEFVGKLSHLEELLLYDCHISNISFAKSLPALRKLDLEKNEVKDISPLRTAKYLNSLNVCRNQISNIFQLKPFTHLSELYIAANPFLENHDIVIDRNESGIDVIKTILQRIGNKSSKKEKINLPSKVLFLGNHASGKSSLVSFLKNKKPKQQSPSTHVLNVEKYSIKQNVNNLPDALFYDFGGQDYYHGIYRVFMSQQAITCLLWHSDTNHNALREDTNNLMNRHFCVEYWLGYWRFYNSAEEEKLSKVQPDVDNQEGEEKVNPSSPLLAIQTHADTTERTSFLPCDEAINQHFVSFPADEENLVNQASLSYLKAQLNKLIKENQKEASYEVWYGEFLKEILSRHKNKASGKSERVTSWLKYYKAAEKNENSKLDNLKSELVQLHRQGLVLYYHNVAPNFVWSNPIGFARYVHDEVLSKNNIEKYKGVVPSKHFENYNRNVVAILEKEKVIFKHRNEEGKEEYLIPNYLPLAEEQAARYRLSTFWFQSSASFTLWFHEYLPLGLINQLVCHFGKQPDDKQFWRDQLLFSLESCTDHPSLVLIKLKFDERLQIQVFINNECITQKKLHTEYVYNVILSLYFDLDTLDLITDFKQYFSEYEKIENHSSKRKEADQSDIDAKFYGIFAKVYKSPPKDLWLSLDGDSYINASDLSKANKETRVLPAINFGKQEQTNKQLAIGDFGAFTHIPLNQKLKVFISYSHDDINYRKDLQKYLVNLERESIIEVWQDGMIETGEDWDQSIKNAMDEADIVIMLVSQSFIASSYVHSVEMPKALGMSEQGKAKIFPILLSQCDYQNWQVLPEACRSALRGDDSKVNIGQFQFFPQSSQGRLEPVNRWQHPEEVWTTVTQKLRELSQA